MVENHAKAQESRSGENQEAYAESAQPTFDPVSASEAAAEPLTAVADNGEVLPTDAKVPAVDTADDAPPPQPDLTELPDEADVPPVDLSNDAEQPAADVPEGALADAPVEAQAPPAATGDQTTPTPSELSDSEPEDPRSLVHSSLVTGEDGVEYDRLLEAVIKEERAESFRQVFLAEQVAHAAWQTRRHREALRCVWNSAIAKSLHNRVIDVMALEELANPESTHHRLTLGEEDVVGQLAQRVWRQWQNLAFDAVSGSTTAIETVEARLGTGAVAINPRIDFDAVIAAETMIARLSAASIAACDSAYRELRREAKRRRKTKADTTPSRSAADAAGSAQHEKADSRAAEVESSEALVTVHAPKPKRDG